jgi:hypothetical protein
MSLPNLRLQPAHGHDLAGLLKEEMLLDILGLVISVHGPKGTKVTNSCQIGTSACLGVLIAFYSPKCYASFMKRAFIKAGTKYVEYGYVIMPIQRETEKDQVRYPEKTVFKMPQGAQISGTKSQNDASKFNTFDDIIRIYALVPQHSIGKEEERTIYVFPTGEDIETDKDAEKLTIVKEGRGDYIWHIYVAVEG